ncbi:MAG: insulinase family protein [Holophagales bacterium]|nr:insulinase family protein [Holophagales bacterium]
MPPRSDRSVPLDRSRPPAPEPVRTFHFPDFDSSYLENGLRVVVLPSRSFPIATLQVLLPAGSERNPVERPGLADLHGGLLDQGTRRRSANQLAGDIEALGGSISSGAGWEVGYAEVDLLSHHWREGLDMLAETVLEATFPADRFDWLVGQNRADLLRRQSSPASIAEDLFARVVYAGTPYAAPGRGTLEALDSTRHGHVIRFHEQHVGPRHATLVVVGDVDPTAVLERAQNCFGSWPAQPAAPLPENRPETLGGIEVHLADRPGSSQTQLYLGHAGPPRAHPDFPALMLVNMVLGGKFTSRLNLNLRERHGFTYGVSTLFSRRKGPGPFFVKAAVGNDDAGAAVREILFELDRLVQEPIGADELRESVDYIRGVFPYTLQTISGLLRRLEGLVVFGFPDDHFDRLYAEIAEIDGEAALAAARRHLHPQRLAIVAVGPADSLGPQLEGFGPVTVHDPEGPGS